MQHIYYALVSLCTKYKNNLKLFDLDLWLLTGRDRDLDRDLDQPTPYVNLFANNYRHIAVVAKCILSSGL